MKVITESMVRMELKKNVPEVYTIPEGALLSPAAREYLQQCRVRIADGAKQKGKAGSMDSGITETPAQAEAGAVLAKHRPEPEKRFKYVDYVTKAYYDEKPEHMTQLAGNMLVPKDHPRILFRGRLDSLQAAVVMAQAELVQMREPEDLLADLQDILTGLMELMRCDVLDEPFTRNTIIGLTHAQLREHSHNPMKFYKIKAMVLPDYTFGKAYAILNWLRAAVRETETAAVQAFHDGTRYDRMDIIQELNRMSSAMHIVMCKYMAGEYAQRR